MYPKPIGPANNARGKSRAAFTLVELLIAVGIMLILTTITVAVYSMTSSADRIRSSARQVQSAFAGARDRAIKYGRENNSAQVGIRLLVDANDSSLVTSFVYVRLEETWKQGSVVVGRADSPNGIPDGRADSAPVTTVRGYGTGWKGLFDQELLTSGARIRIPEDGEWYTIDTSLLSGAIPTRPEVLILSRAFSGSVIIPYGNGMVPPTPGSTYPVWGVVGDDDQDGTADNIGECGWLNSDDETDANPLSTGNLGQTYKLELQPNILPGQEPLRLSSGIAIDLDNSIIPAGWIQQQQSLARGSALPASLPGYGSWTVAGPDPNNGANDLYRIYSPHMDVMFSPRGGVVGPVSAQGMIHLRLADVEDIALNRDPADPQATTMLYSTLFTQTGNVGTFPVNITDTNNDKIADDPRYFTRVGSTVGR